MPAAYKKFPARHYVATYGDAGLEIQLFDDPLEYGRAVKVAQTDHERGYNEFGDIDSYTNGDCTISRPDTGEAATITNREAFAMVGELKQAGFAVVIFTPEELAPLYDSGMDNSDFEDSLVQAGNETLTACENL